MKLAVKIPMLVHDPNTPICDGYVIASQPILQFKELEIDRVRYDQWKAMLARPTNRKVVKVYK